MRKSNACIFDSASSPAIYVLVWTVWILGPLSSLRARAEDQSLPSWRRGISTWNGSSYDLPAKVSSSRDRNRAVEFDSTALAPAEIGPVTDGPVQIRPAVPPEVPYVVPTDPSAPKINPYFEPSSKHENTPFTLTVPHAETDSNPHITIDAPENAVQSVSRTPMRISAPESTLAPPVRAATTPDAITNPIVATDPSQPEPIASSEDPFTAAAPAMPDSDAAATLTPDSSTSDSSTSAGPAEVGESEPEREAAPLEEEVIRWYQYPRRWMRGWDSHAEFGLDGSNGNADTLAIQTGLELRRKSDLHSLVIDVDYRQASSRSVTTEDNGRLNIDYDRLLNDTPWSAFGKFGLEYDEFKRFDLRLNVNGGIGYYWIRRDDANLVTRFGAGASREMGAPVDDWIAEAVFGIDSDRQLNPRNKIRAKVDYFPAWEDFRDYRLVADFAWEILLDDTDNLSLKLAATDRYDSTPQGAKPNDVYYSLLLLYKF